MEVQWKIFRLDLKPEELYVVGYANLRSYRVGSNNNELTTVIQSSWLQAGTGNKI